MTAEKCLWGRKGVAGNLRSKIQDPKSKDGHNGTIDVESQVGQGTKITVRSPSAAKNG